MKKMKIFEKLLETQNKINEIQQEIDKIEELNKGATIVIKIKEHKDGTEIKILKDIKKTTSREIVVANLIELEIKKLLEVK